MRQKEGIDLDAEENAGLREDISRMCDEILESLDVDGNGFVNLDEVVQDYHNQRRDCMEEIEGLELQIADQEQRKEALLKRLEEIKLTEKPTIHTHPTREDRYIMKGSTLSVHVIDARNLQSTSGFSNAQVRLSIEDQSSNT